MNSLKNKKILIFGTGAVGGYYGGVLVKAGFDVTFVARGKNYEVLKKNGLTLIINGKKEIIPINVAETIHELPKGKPFDYIFICVKSMDTKNAANQIKNNVGPNTTVLSFQNGIENEEIISSVVGKEHVIGAYVYIASQMTEPGVVNMTGNHTATIGEFNGEKTKRILDLESVIKSAGVKCIISDDIAADLWNKLVWNGSFNPVSVLSSKTVDKILEDKELYELLKNIMGEVKEVAIAHGINIRPDTVEFNLDRSKNIKSPNAHHSQNFTGFKTSMLQDYERGKPLELEELVGVVIRKAKEKNISVPNIERVYKEVKQKLTFVETRRGVSL